MVNEKDLVRTESIPLMEREDIVPEKIRQYYSELPEELVYASEEDLRKTGKIRLLDERLRSGFWRELQIALNTKKKIKSKRIYTGLCSEQHFYRIISVPERLAWITQPVIPYEARTDALLTLAVGRYEEVLNMPITSKKRVVTGLDDNGKITYGIEEVIDPFRAKLLMDTIKNLEERVKGLSVQRQVTLHEKSSDSQPVDLSMDEINKRLSEVNSKLGITADKGDVIDVTPMDKNKDTDGSEG